MSDNVIEIMNLRKSYPGFDLGPLNLSIPRGSIVGFIGENGAGKTTTIRLILGLAHPQGGEIKIFGKDIKEDPKTIKSQLGVVFDSLNLPGDLTVMQTGRICARIFPNWADKTYGDLLEKLQVDPKKKVKELSRGNTMKLSLTIALSHNPHCLLLDEVTSGLDPVVREEILGMLLDFIQDEDHSVLISSHILSDLEKIADYIAFIHKGQLVFMEDKNTLQEEYALCSCDSLTAKGIPEAAIVGRRRNEFGEHLLLKRSLTPSHLRLEIPSIEDIMLFYIKGGPRQ